jgi:hypothetical protein
MSKRDPTNAGVPQSINPPNDQSTKRSIHQTINPPNDQSIAHWAAPSGARLPAQRVPVYLSGAAPHALRAHLSIAPYLSSHVVYIAPTIPGTSRVFASHSAMALPFSSLS